MAIEKKSAQELKEWAWFLIQVISFVTFVHAFLFKPFYIPSGSMIPSLLVGDYLIVSKYSYGFSRYSIPFGYAIRYFDGRLFQWQTPQRGDIVVFRLPFATDGDDYIKRVIGLPGDQIQVRQGYLYVNGEQVSLENVGPYKNKSGPQGELIQGTLYHQKLPGGVKHPILRQIPLGSGAWDETPIYHVPDKHYFMMGDNTNGSKDSRFLHEVGYIPEDCILGKAQLIFFSTEQESPWWNLFSWLQGIRFNRFFSWIR